MNNNRAIKGIDKTKLKARKVRGNILDGSPGYYLITIPFASLSFIGGVEDAIVAYKKFCMDFGVLSNGGNSMELEVIVSATIPLKRYIKRIKNIAEYALVSVLFGDINFDYSNVSMHDYLSWNVRKPVIPVIDALCIVTEESRVIPEKDPDMRWHDYQDMKEVYRECYTEAGAAYGFLYNFANSRCLYGCQIIIVEDDDDWVE